MSKNKIKKLINFLFCKRNNYNKVNRKPLVECAICLEEKEVEFGCFYCNFKCCKDCKTEWYFNNKTCPICRQNNVL